MPPHRSVTLTLDGGEFRRPLRFFNFGNALHDELVEGWLPQNSETLFIDVNLLDDHAFFKYGESGLHLLRFSLLDPGSALSANSVEKDAMVDIMEAARAPHDVPLERLMDQIQSFKRAVRCAIEADMRWLRAQLTAELLVQGLRRANEHWVRTGADAIGRTIEPDDTWPQRDSAVFRVAPSERTGACGSEGASSTSHGRPRSGEGALGPPAPGVQSRARN